MDKLVMEMKHICYTVNNFKCNNPILDKFSCCESCIRECIDVIVNSQYRHFNDWSFTDVTAASYEHKIETCLYNFTRGKYKGLYCSNKCYPGFSMCEICINRILPKENYDVDTCNYSKISHCNGTPLTELGFGFCEDCIKNKISENIKYKSGSERKYILDLDKITISTSKPEKGKCLSKIRKGPHEGWYCCTPVYNEFDYCLCCIRRMMKYEY